MTERKTYKGRVIEARAGELRDGLGWDATCYIEEPDGGGVMVTPFFLPNTFSTSEAAIQAALQVGRKKIDLGFEYKSVVSRK